jgi:thiol-disulfide isomerase/thioredoxin
MKFKKPLAAVLLLTLSYFTGFAQHHISTGVWRGALKTASGAEVPFNFEVNLVNGKDHIVIINGEERFKVDNVTQLGDSVFIKMPLFDSEFKLKITGADLKGTWIKHLGDKDAVMDFMARPNTPWRFLETNSTASVNITGLYSAVFIDGAKRIPTVGEFKQTANRLTGTFLSTTGDYRYLDGVVAGNKIFLSTFDGGHAFTFTGEVKGSKIINGKFYAGLSSVSNWEATKNPNAKLPDAYSLTGLKPGSKKIAFTFKDIYGQKVSLTDARFKNKVVIVQIMGSWCPNCMDETAYLIDYYKKYHSKGVEIVGLAYERTTDFAKSQKMLAQLKARFNVPYPLLITGYTNAAGEPAKSLPMVANFMGFPTTIIVDKHGDVAKVHTGFSGPGTGKYYDEFKTEFEGLTDKLLAEK